MEIKVDGRLLVSTLCERFKEEFGGTLRVYQGNKRLTGAEKVSEIGIDLMKDYGLAAKRDLIKVLGNGEIKSAVTVTADAFSKSAISKIEAAGGKAVVIE